MSYTPIYKKGDVVIIKASLSKKDDNVVDSMLKYAEKKVTITGFGADEEDNCYRIKEDGGYWSWGDNMIDHNTTIEGLKSGQFDYEIY